MQLFLPQKWHVEMEADCGKLIYRSNLCTPFKNELKNPSDLSF